MLWSLDAVSRLFRLRPCCMKSALDDLGLQKLVLVLNVVPCVYVSGVLVLVQCGDDQLYVLQECSILNGTMRLYISVFVRSHCKEFSSRSRKLLVRLLNLYLSDF